MNIYEKLIKIQNELKTPKNQYNSFGKYAYRSCEDILEGLKPILLSNKATVFINDEIVFIEGRFYIKATVTFLDVETGEKIENSAFAREEESKKGMDGSQVTGACSSYARKYALNGMFAIDDTKDADATNEHVKSKSIANKTNTTPATSNKTNTGLITDKQKKMLFAISNGKTDEVKEILGKYGYTSSSEIKMKDFNNICDEIRNLG